jgi:hypothetical protein
MKFFTEINTFYPLPTIKFNYDFFFEGELIYLDLEIVWLRWGVSINIIREK